MNCPSCSREQPMSFRCRFCGADLVRQTASRPTTLRPPVRPATTPPPIPDVNPYAAPTAPPPLPETSYRPQRDPSSDAVSRLPLAGRGARLLAHLLDSVLAVGCFLPGIIVIAVAPEKNGQVLAIIGLLFLLIALIGLLVFQVSLLRSEGQTWGKQRMGVRIVLYDTDEIPGLGRSLGMRLFVSNLIGSVPCVGPLYSLTDILFIFGEERRCLHDLIAGTKVVEAG